MTEEQLLAAQLQLTGEGGIDTLDLHSGDKGIQICLDMVGLLIRLQKRGELRLASQSITDDLAKLRDAELEAIVLENQA